MTGKVHRQQTVARIIAEHVITNQPTLVQMLASEGITATQATVSRDLDEIGAIKVRAASGEVAYAIPEFEPDRIAPVDQLRRVLADWVAEVRTSEPIVVLRTPPGCAHVVASALDRSRLEGLIGTVAGDDTVLCVASSKTGAKRLAADLSSLAGRGSRS